MIKLLKKIIKIIFKTIKFFTPYGIHKFFQKYYYKHIDLKISGKAVNFEKNNITTEDFNVKPFKKDCCIILGNGPSLKKTFDSPNQYDFIKKYPKFCVNSFINTYEFFELKPEYIVFMDPFYWAKNISEQFKPEILKTKENILKANWNITIFMPKYAEEWNFFCDISNNNIRLIYINTNVSGEIDFDKKINLFKTNKAMPQVQNVLVACLYIGLNIGFKKLYLFGADHSWHENLMVDENNILNIKDVHFYDKTEIKFNKAYSEADLSKTFNMSNFFEALSKKFYSYMELEKYSKVLDSKIYNASEKSYIDAFEKIKI